MLEELIKLGYPKVSANDVFYVNQGCPDTEEEVRCSAYVAVITKSGWEKAQYIPKYDFWVDQYGTRIPKVKIKGYIDIDELLKTA